MSIAERLRNSWAILPATRTLFNKNKVSVREISSEWQSGTVLICRKTNYMGDADGYLYIYSCGNSDATFQHYTDRLGRAQTAHHDQTFANIGPVIVVNVVRYTRTPTSYSEELACPINGNNYVDSAPLYVFK